MQVRNEKKMIETIHRYKDLIFYKAWANLRSEARGYYVGYAWWIFEPAIEMLVFYLVFNVLFHRGESDFIQFLLIGLVVWKWFGTTVQHCGNSMMGAKVLIQQTALPKIIFPSVYLLTDTFKAAIVAVLVLILLFSTGYPPNPAYLALPILLITQFLLITAVGYTLAAIVPFFPDLGILVNLLLRMLWFLSGIFFNPRSISEAKRDLFFMNPMARLIDNYRGIFLHQEFPKLKPLLVIACLSIIVIHLASNFISRRDTLYPRIVAQ